jgi:hypothetical protein
MRRRDSWWHPSIARRAWRPSERLVVMRGFWGRFFIAVEPLTIALCFTGLSIGLLLRHQEGAIFIAPIFGGAALLFYTYAVVLMMSVTRAVIESFGSIWVVDGYVQYREHLAPNRDPAYYVAVLDEERRVLGRVGSRRAVARARRVLPPWRHPAHRRTFDGRAARRYSRARRGSARCVRPQHARRLT